MSNIIAFSVYRRAILTRSKSKGRFCYKYWPKTINKPNRTYGMILVRIMNENNLVNTSNTTEGKILVKIMD